MSAMVIAKDVVVIEPEYVKKKPWKKPMNVATKMAMKQQWKRWKERPLIEWDKDLECINVWLG